MASANYIKKIALVGASGQFGKFIVKELLATKKFEMTAITRADSQNPVPEGVKAAKVNYDDHQTLVSALRGHDALVITMNTRAPHDSQLKLVEAAAEADVPYVIPSDWCPPMANEKFADAMLLGPGERAVRKRVEELGKSSWIAFITGFWYEYSVGWGSTTFGFDIPKRTVTFFDDGMQKINTSTWPQSARAVAKVLSLPITSETGPSISGYKNKFVYVSSFGVNQKDMFQSLLRVTGTKEAEWTVNHEDIEKRYQTGQETLQAGDRMGFIKMMYSRVFFNDGQSHFQDLLANEALGLPVEDLDEATRIGVERAQGGSAGKD